MTADHTPISVFGARLICRVAARAGVRPEELLGEVGLSLDALEDPEEWMSYAQSRRLWAVAARRTGDPCFGLHAAESLESDSFGAFGLTVRTSRNGRDAVQRMVSYVNRYFADIEMGLETNPSVARLHHRFRSDPAGSSAWVAPAIDFILASFVLLGREYTGIDWKPILVTLQHPEPESSECQQEYARIFRSPVLYRQPENAVIFDRALLRLRLLGHQPQLLKTLERHVEEVLAKLPQASGVMDKARLAVVEGIQSGDTDLASTAKALQMSSRSLQRRLMEEGTSHRELLNELREELAGRYLGEPELSIDQIAFFLGFNQTTTFRRAFQRWKGQTPSAYRHRLLSSSRRTEH
jgi:AraC-like DNA-binding protein